MKAQLNLCRRSENASLSLLKTQEKHPSCFNVYPWPYKEGMWSPSYAHFEPNERPLQHPL